MRLLLVPLDKGYVTIDGQRAALTDLKDTVVQVAATLVAINVSGHQPRYRNVATQYFHWLLAGESPAWAYPGENSRVIYAETFFPGQDPSELLAESEIDADAAEAFFGNRWRLSEDLLSDGATDCMANLPAKDQAHR